MAEINNKIKNNSNADLPETPETLVENKDILYNCTECSSLIEVLLISEDKNIIKFKCLNKDCNAEKTMSMNEYFEKMEKYKQRHVNEDICQKHISSKNNKYVSYCFDCNCHLCEECLKTREHICHNKNYIIEIKPIKEELNIIEEVIKDYRIKIENLKNEKINREKELENILNTKKINEEEKIKNKLKSNDKNKNKELKLNNDKYKSDIEEIKKRYEKEIKERENKYKKDEDKINNKYKVIAEKERVIHKLKIEELNKKYHDIINNLTYDKTIEKMTNTKKINEVIFNTYNLYNDNYYNSININQILLSYFSNDHIKNKIMKKILNNKYEEIIKITLKKRDEENIRKEKDENEKKIEKEKKDLKINEIKEEYEKQLKELKEEKKRFEEKLKKIIEENEIKNEKTIKEKEEQFKKELDEIKKKISHKYLFLINIFCNLLYNKIFIGGN